MRRGKLAAIRKRSENQSSGKSLNGEQVSFQKKGPRAAGFIGTEKRKGEGGKI